MKTLQKIRPRILAIAALMALCVLGGEAYAAPGGDPGKPGDTGGGNTAPDLGDLFVLYRNNNGVPILTEDFCQQPLAAPGQDLPAIAPYDACIAADQPNNTCIIPVDPETCAVALGYETYTQEVEFGRTNAVRSQESVFEDQLEDAVVKLATADCVTRDPAGRLVVSTVTPNADPLLPDVVTTSAIDSPLQNLAIYRQLMLTGFLGAESYPLTLPGDTLDIAAMAIGAASDKAGEVTVDMIAYINQILGLTEAGSTLLPKTCIQVKEEVQGVIKMVQKCFLDYSDFGAYDRVGRFMALPSPPYIPEGSPEPGTFEYLLDLMTDPPSFEIAHALILDTVPELGIPFDNLENLNLNAFAKAADDSRAVIDFMHNWPIPGDYGTPLICEASGDINYDVSISDVSGLQVPVRMVAGTEGREFTLTVANAGPDLATGNVEVTAVDADGISIPTFPRSFDFTIIAGASQSWTEFFSVDAATTVTWTATAVPDCDTCDANPLNNSVTEITTVTGQGGGNGNKPN